MTTQPKQYQTKLKPLAAMLACMALTPVAYAEEQAAISESAQTLPEIKVVGEVDPTAPYAGGQVARGGQVGLLGDLDFLDMPFSATSFTSEFIQNKHARTLGDVVKYDASVQSQRGPGDLAEQFTIRGFGIGSGASALNGLYGVGPGYNSVTESLERVELFKGPNALLTGNTGSVGGTINQVTKKAGAESLLQLTGTYAGDSVVGAHLDAGRRFGTNKEFGIRVNVAHREGDTSVDRQTERTSVAAVGLDYTVENFRLSGDVGYQKRHRGSPISQIYLDGVSSVPSVPTLGNNYQQSWEFQASEDLYGMVKAEYDLAKNWTAHLSFGAADGSYTDQRNILTQVDGAGNSEPLNPYYSIEYQRNKSLDIGVNGQFTTGFVGHKVSVSATSIHQRYGYADGGDLGFPPGFITNLYQYVERPRFYRQDFGISDQRKLGNKTILSSLAVADILSMDDGKYQLILGARSQRVQSDNYDTATGLLSDSYDKNKLTPSVGFTVKPVKNIALYGNYIEGLDQGPTAPVGSANQGKVFPPTQSEQMELGVKFDFGKFATTVAVYQIKQPNGFVNPTTNLFGLDGEQRNCGLELNVFGEPVDHLRLLGSVTVSKNVLTKTDAGLFDGKLAAGNPKTQMNVSAEWDVPTMQGLTIGSGASFVSSQYTDQDNTRPIPGYAVVDLSARYAFKAYGKSATLRANLNNALGKDYYSSATNGLILGYPRTLFVSTSVDF